MLIDGQRGAGKTRLLREIIRTVRARSFTVIEQHAAAGYALEDLADPALRTAPPAAPSGIPRQPSALPRGGQPGTWLAEQLDARIVEQAAFGPVLVAVDDLHRAGQEWLSALTVPPPLVSNHQLIWALTRQSGMGGAAVDRVFGTANPFVTKVELAPLDDDATAQITTDLLGAPPDTHVRRLVATTGGDLSLLVELVHGLLEEDKVAIQRGVARLRCGKLPRRVQILVQERLLPLSAESRQLLQVASVLGRTFAVDKLAAMLREATAALLPALEEALAAGLLVCDSRRLAFSHPIAWRVIWESMPASVRDALAWDARLLRGARSDAEAARPAPSVANGVVGVEPSGAAEIAPIVAAIDAQLLSGTLASTAALAREALARPLPEAHTAALKCRLAHVLVMSGQPQQAATLAEQALAVPGLPQRLRGEAAAAAVLALSLHDANQAQRRAEEILAQPDPRTGDPAIATAAAVLSNLVWDGGDMAEGLRLARTAVAGIDQTTPPAWRMHARLALARKLSNRRDFADAAKIIDETQREISEFGLALHAAAPSIARARLLVQVGRLPESQAEARSALAVAQEVGANLLVPLALSVLATVALRTGDLLTAADYVRRYRADVAAGNTPLWSAQYDWVELLLAAEQDGPRRAMELLGGRHAGLPTRRLLLIEEPGAAAWLVRLAVATGDLDVAKAAVHTAECLAARNPDHPTVVAAATHARGLLDRDAEALRRACTDHLEPWAAAWAAEDLGLHMLDAGADTATAIDQLEDALRRFEDIEAERDAARVRNRLRALGVRRRKSGGAEKVALLGWAGLSDMERTIAHLVNHGLTNRQIAKRVFLSPHTVNYHLRQIFRKLDIKSRVELARLTQEQCLPRVVEPAGGHTSETGQLETPVG